MMVRRGRMPSFSSWPRARVSSIMLAVPLLGIDAAEDPGVAMIAEDHPFVGQFGAADAAFDDVVRLEAVVHFDFEMDFFAVAAEVIGETESALPGFGSDGAVHIFEQRLGVVPGERQRHNFRGGDGLLDGDVVSRRGLRPIREWCGSPGTMKS